MRSFAATLSLVLVIIVSFGCKKKEDAQNQPPAANQTATTATAPAGNTATAAPANPTATPTTQNTAPAGQPTTNQSSTAPSPSTQPVATQPAPTPAPAKPTILATQKILMKPGLLALADRDSIAGTWRGTTAKTHSQLIFHFNADGWGSMDYPKYDLHVPASVTKWGDAIEITLTSSESKFVGKIKDRSMTGTMIDKNTSEELQLTKD